MTEENHYSLHIIPLIICLVLGLAGWYCPHPAEISTQGWHLLVIFVVTILSLIIKPLPMGACALISLMIAVSTHVITMKQGFAGFSNDVVWLVVFALFIAKGFQVTGLDKRIAYFFYGTLG